MHGLTSMGRPTDGETRLGREALAGFDRSLTAAFQQLDATGADMLPVPDAGVVTPQVAGILAHLVQDAGTLAMNLDVAARRVAQSRQTYVDADLATDRAVNGAGRPPAGPV